MGPLTVPFPAGTMTPTFPWRSNLQENADQPVADGITQAIFNHLVDLAAFRLEAEEAEYLRRELNGQLEAIRELEAIPKEKTVQTE